MQVGLCIARVVKVNNHIHRHDVDTASEQLSAHQTTRITVLEIVVNSTSKLGNSNYLPVAVVLVHAGVDVEATVAERVDLLSEQLYTFTRVAENNRLGDL